MEGEEGGRSQGEEGEEAEGNKEGMGLSGWTGGVIRVYSQF